MIITGDDTVGISSLKQFLSHQFETKDLGLLSYFLGLEISHDPFGYFLTQAKYISDLLTCVGLIDCKALVGSLDYLTATHLNIAYVVHIVSQFMAASHFPHYDALAEDPTDRRSTTGFCFFLGDSFIAWRIKKQTLVARSSTKAEYRALVDTTQELV
ncbi:uncharacterized protein LOC114322974 [Camellia sinensis]|uniref:uncharacterized protein LOC114322974 n=1 Tax=Camellia sinensis TaxID=4442 RepID=UPI001036A02B|nr:uncharacterized protein LOC114322974 [Camellia sinensis]